MATPPRLQLTETSPGYYEIRWTLPDDIDPGTYQVTGSEVVSGLQLAATPSAQLTVLSTGAPALVPAPPPSPPPPEAPPPAEGPTPPGPRGRVPGLDYGWRDPRLAAIENQYWTTPDDILILGVRNRVVGVSVTFTARVWDPDGHLAASAVTITPPSDGSVTYYSMPLAYGYLVAAAAVLSAGTVRLGQCLVSLRIGRPPLSNFLTYWYLGQDYLTAQKAVFWPPGRVVDGGTFPGRVYTVIGSAPGAGSDFQFTVPANTRWLIRNVAANLTTSAVAANRTPDLQLTLSGGAPLRLAGTQVTPANTSQFYYWAPGLPVAGVTNVNQSDQWIPPDLVLNAGTTIGPVTVNMQGGDSWGTPVLWVEEVIED